MAEELRPPTVTLADPRTAVSNILLRLGIPTKMRGYAFLREAVLVMAHDRTQSVTKELYPTVAQRCGGNPLQVERTIRAAIHSAWDNRDESAWNQVFHTSGPIPRPTNSAIISLLAEQLGNDDNEASRRVETMSLLRSIVCKPFGPFRLIQNDFVDDFLCDHPIKTKQPFILTAILLQGFSGFPLGPV